MKIKRLSLLALLLAAMLLLAGCNIPLPEDTTAPVTTAPVTTAPVTTAPVTTAPATTAPVTTAPVTTAPATTAPATTAPQGPGSAATLDDIPAFSGYPYVILNENIPAFTAGEIEDAEASYEYFSDLDTLGRCGVVHASVGQDIMPTEERGSIGMVKPSGWQTAKYDIVNGKYLYNRCHLIGFQLTGENANNRNLITGTRYLNIEGMLPFENMIADYVKDTGNHVLYRVTPVYVGNELVARGVVMEAYSIEDEGDGISFHVFAYNVQPGIVINYADGTSYLSSEPPITAPPTTTTPSTPSTPSEPEEEAQDYVVNNNTDKFHLPTCQYANSMKPENREEVHAKRSELIESFDPCGSCKP